MLGETDVDLRVKMCVMLQCILYVPGFRLLIIVIPKLEHHLAIILCLSHFHLLSLLSHVCCVISVIFRIQLSICAISIYSQSTTLTIDL